VREARPCGSTGAADGHDHSARSTDLTIIDDQAVPTGRTRWAFSAAEARAHRLAGDPVQALLANALVRFRARFSERRTIIHATGAGRGGFAAPAFAITVGRTSGATVVLDARTLRALAPSGTGVSECADRLDARAIDAEGRWQTVGVVFAALARAVRALRLTVSHWIEETDSGLIISGQARLARVVDRIHRRLDGSGYVPTIGGAVGAVDFTRVGEAQHVARLMRGHAQ
jgi:hypothetical protein